MSCWNVQYGDVGGQTQCHGKLVNTSNVRVRVVYDYIIAMGPQVGDEDLDTMTESCWSHVLYARPPTSISDLRREIKRVM